MMSPDLQLYQAFHSIVNNQSSGILKVQSGTSVLLCIFSKGTCLDVGTNVVDQLPGTFLYQQKMLNEQQYQNYMKKYSAPKTNQWRLANAEINLAPGSLFEKRKQHAKKIMGGIDFSAVTGVQFQSMENLPSEKPVIENKDITMTWASRLTQAKIFILKPEIENKGNQITIVKEPAKNVFTEDQNGLITVIQHNSTLSEILDSSFLEKEKIFQWLLAFETLGIVRIESTEGFEKRLFLDSLKPEQIKLRNQLEKAAERILQENFYKILGVEADADAKDLQIGLTLVLKKFDIPEFKNVFFKTENKIHLQIIEKIRHAYSVLSDPEKRKEYDSFIKQGKGMNFVDQSLTIQEEKFLKELSSLIAAKKFVESVEFLGKKIQEHPQFLKLYASLVDVVRKQNIIADEKLNQNIFEWFKLGIAKNPDRSEPFLLLGEWCLLLNQKNNALKAFQKALFLNAGSQKNRAYILELDPANGNQTIVEAVFQNLEKLNHFELLGVPSTASPQEIRDTYRFVSRSLHPDRFFTNANGALKDMSKRVFKEIVASYMILKDEEKSKAYQENLFSSQTKKDEKQKATPPKSPQARKYYDRAIMFMQDANFSSAKLNVQLALSYEPENYLLQKMLKEIQAK